MPPEEGASIAATPQGCVVLQRACAALLGAALECRALPCAPSDEAPEDDLVPERS